MWVLPSSAWEPAAPADAEQLYTHCQTIRPPNWSSVLKSIISMLGPSWAVAWFAGSYLGLAKWGVASSTKHPASEAEAELRFIMYFIQTPPPIPFPRARLFKASTKPCFKLQPKLAEQAAPARNCRDFPKFVSILVLCLTSISIQITNHFSSVHLRTM